MKVRSKESGNIYDVCHLVTTRGFCYSLSEIDIVSEQTESYDYEALRNELAAKLFTMAIKSDEADVALDIAIDSANEFIQQLKKSPVEWKQNTDSRLDHVKYNRSREHMHGKAY